MIKRLRTLFNHVVLGTHPKMDSWVKKATQDPDKDISLEIYYQLSGKSPLYLSYHISRFMFGVHLSVGTAVALMSLPLLSLTGVGVGTVALLGWVIPLALSARLVYKLSYQSLHNKAIKQAKKNRQKSLCNLKASVE